MVTVPQSPIWAAIGRQLRNPSGFGGGLIARLMAFANRQPNWIAIDALKIAPSDTVLELGFGPGSAIRTLNSMVPHGRVFGIDHSAAMLAQASRYNRRAIRIGRVQLQQGRFDALPWASDTFDKILAVNVVYFFCADAAEIREARRVLRPGGMMAIYATHKSAMTRWRFCCPETHRLFDEHELLTLILKGAAANDEVSVCSVTLALRIAGVLAILRKGTGGS
jgi:ubiquinone/menaquinone biosynthesis C-methylase UbiE